jgi:hypothetical protein
MSQLMRYSTACGSYHDFLVRGLLLPRNLLKQWLLVIIMKLPLEFYVCHHDFTNRYGISASQLITDAFCLCYYHNPVLYSFMIYYQSCNKSNTMGGTNGALTAYLPEQLSLSTFYNGVRVARSLDFCVIFCRSFFVLLTLYLLPLYCLFFLDFWHLQIYIGQKRNQNA